MNLVKTLCHSNSNLVLAPGHEPIPIEMKCRWWMILHVINISKIQDIFNEHAKFTIVEKVKSVSLPNKFKMKSFRTQRFLDSLIRDSVSKRFEYILKLSPRHNWFPLVKLFQFLLCLISALFIQSFLEFLLSRG